MIRFISLLFLWLPFTIAANITYTPCKLCINEASPKKLAEIELRLYTGPTVDNYTSVQVGDVLDLFELIDTSKPTAVFIFGWLGTPDAPSTQAVIRAYLDRGDHNFLILDWNKISCARYTYAVRSLKGIGYTVATALNKLVAAGLDQTSVHLIGLSLGAQISGFTGRFVDFRLPRITGLDPAGPGFEILTDHLTHADAEFVAIVHTDRGGFGLDSSTGHVDFYPNDGIRSQPGCLNELEACSHYRACYFYAESVRNENSFIGLSCDLHSDFEAGLCSSNPTIVMGHGTPTNATGKYYLHTNSESPYGREENGTKNPDLNFI